MFSCIEEIKAWKLARQLAKEIWIDTQQGTFAKDWKLKDQINDAAGSIMDNIAEGYGRGGNKEFSNFLSMARGSAQEVKSQLDRAYDRQHLSRSVTIFFSSYVAKPLQRPIRFLLPLTNLRWKEASTIGGVEATTLKNPTSGMVLTKVNPPFSLIAYLSPVS